MPVAGTDVEGSGVSVVVGSVGDAGVVVTRRVLSLLVEGQDIGVRPAGDVPGGEIQMVSTDVHHGVDDGGSTETLTGSDVLLVTVPVEIEFTTFVEVAVVEGGEGGSVPVDWDGGEVGVFGGSSRFDDENLGFGVGRESVGKHTASSSSSDDDEVEALGKASRSTDDRAGSVLHPRGVVGANVAKDDHGCEQQQRSQND